ncbi:MAG TPA: hypothetical protein VKQ52_03360 [Puia sp.]|nr:hypothetical protein [Puia sp.]
MGEFLHIALIREFTVCAPPARSPRTSLDRFKSAVAALVVDSPDSFDCVEEAGILRWTWKRDVRQAWLTGLLNRYYADFYDAGSDFFLANCKPVLGFLAGAPSDEEWLDWMEKEGSEAFYPMNGSFRTIVLDCKGIQVQVSLVSLSSEGKVRLEESQGHLPFFEKLLRRAYAGNPLAGCLTFLINTSQPPQFSARPRSGTN